MFGINHILSAVYNPWSRCGFKKGVGLCTLARVYAGLSVTLICTADASVPLSKNTAMYILIAIAAAYFALTALCLLLVVCVW